MKLLNILFKISKIYSFQITEWTFSLVLRTKITKLIKKIFKNLQQKISKNPFQLANEKHEIHTYFEKVKIGVIKLTSGTENLQKLPFFLF